MKRILTLFAAAALVGGMSGCAALVEPNLDANGCRPAMAIYQPPVRLGGAGQVINIPASCPSSAASEARIARARAEAERVVAQMTAAQASASAPAPTQAPSRPAPPAHVEPVAAILNGVDRFCGWFLGGQPYSLEGLRQAAFDAGYGRGAPVQMIPLKEMREAASYSTMGFTAVIADPPSNGHGMAAFVTFHDPACQVLVYGYADAAQTALARLESEGWRKDGGPITLPEMTAQRYRGHGMTLTAHRPSGPAEGARLELILNLTPGETSTRGLLD
ncbi:hypothetical protein SH203_02438 [Brevundimonas sp. SH203]|uniref:hypothetical protein n=1 Tax=Brevundimonas sp. SH203 TaxID=345167 RepID=UPI0009D43FA3|nr:hypothetical protein [Brevundimonas sp. SH203]GAW42025.1 hypothetical protein SH203_02438 [Brevundimonas sp. SH203]